MDETAFAPLSPWTGLLRRGRFGASGQEPGVLFGAPPPCAMALLVARKGRDGELAKAARDLGAELPAPGRWAQGRTIMLLSAAPSQWLARRPGSYAELQAELAGVAPHAYLIDQSEARVTLTIAGPAARDALAKGFEIDLHPRAFGPGRVALTQAASISAMLWQIDEAPTYEVAVPRSFAGSFWHWLSEASAEYGFRIGEPAEA